MLVFANTWVAFGGALKTLFVPPDPCPTLLCMPDHDLYDLRLPGSLALWLLVGCPQGEAADQRIGETSFAPWQGTQWTTCIPPPKAPQAGSPLLQPSLAPSTNSHLLPFSLGGSPLMLVLVCYTIRTTPTPL